MKWGEARRIALGLTAIALTQCAKERTGLVVTVWSELAWGEGRDLQSLVVTVRRGSADGAVRWQQTKVLGASAGQWRIPLSFGLYPADPNDVTPVWIEVLGCSARDGCVPAGALVTQRAVVSYRPAQTVALDLWLAARCRGVSCATNQTCARETGMCVAARDRDLDVRPLPGGVVPSSADAQSVVPDAASDGARDAPDDADAPDVTRIDASEVGADVLFDADVTAIDADVAITPDAPAIDVVDVSPADVVDVPVDTPVGCVAPRVTCGGACVDAQTNDRNCGACGRACTSGQRCSAGACETACPTGQSNCGGVCAATGGACSVGVGACARTGAVVCGAGMSTRCSVSAGSPMMEVCDGVDNDCDGLADEGSCRIAGTCYTNGQANPSNACQVCAAPTSMSAPTTWTTLASCGGCASGTMTCGSACIGLGTACSVGTGGCTRSGSVICAAATAVEGCFNITCALKPNGTLSCWGYNAYGYFGDGTTTFRSVPVDRMGLSGVVAMACNGQHFCALLGDGTVRCWGNNDFGQLGDGTTTNATTPVTVSGLSGVQQVSCGYQSCCARRFDGTVWCWGRNQLGQLGDETTTDRRAPVQVASLSSVVAIASGDAHTCAIRQDSTVWCWGFNRDGELGDGTTTTRQRATQIPSFSGAAALAAGTSHTCALMNDRTIRCWGRNDHGELGNAGMAMSASPVTVLASAATPLSNAVQLASGNYHNCAVLADGGVRCWGWNANGQLGDGTRTNGTVAVTATYTPTGTSTPLPVIALSLGLGDTHSCAVANDGVVRCWGSNEFGALGDGTTTERVRGVAVSLPASGAGCAVVPGTASSEICNGVDDDCDGLVDEGLSC